MSTAVKPTRTPKNNAHEDYTETHPAYAMIGASRVTSTPGATLFGSDLRHRSYVVIEFGPAELSRGLSSDWYHRQRQTFAVALSEAQWATFLSTMNVGDGVPCTLQYQAGIGELPRIDPITDRREQLSTEVTDRLEHAMGLIEEALQAPGLRKADKSALQIARNEIGANLGFVARQFDEAAERTVEKAKVEIAAYLTQAVQRAGLRALSGGESPLLELAGGSDEAR